MPQSLPKSGHTSTFVFLECFQVISFNPIIFNPKN